MNNMDEKNIENESVKYTLKVEKLFKNVNEVETVEEKVKLFEEFTNKFTSISNIWREWARIINANQSVEVQNDNKKKLWTKAMSHFYIHGFADDIFQLSDNLNRDLLWNKIYYRRVQWGIKSVKPLLYYLQHVKKSFSLPNDKLQKYLEFYEEFSTKPVPQWAYQEHQNLRQLFYEIMHYYPYQNEWMLNMKKVGDDKFIIQNIEHKLFLKYADKRIWMVYIEFLKEKCYWKWLLNVYSRFCRLFTDDLEMKKQYKNEIENIQKLDFDVKKWKYDLIKIENDFGSTETSLNLMKEYFGKEIQQSLLEDDMKMMQPDEIPDYAVDEQGLLPFRTTKSAKFLPFEKQTFAFPSNFLYSILQKSDSKMLQKLYSSSKQLYSMTNTPVCHRLEINEFEATVTFEQSLFISLNDVQIGNAKKLFISNSFVIKTKHRTVLTEFIPRIYKCTVKYLTIFEQDISLQDFEFLVKDVEKFFYLESTIKWNKKYLSIVEIIDRMPKVSHVTVLTDGAIEFETKNLPEFFKEKSTKIDYLKICTIMEVDDPLKICSFIWKNAAPSSHFYIQLKTTQEYVENLDNIIKIELNNWVPENTKPCTIIQTREYFF